MSAVERRARERGLRQRDGKGERRLRRRADPLRERVVRVRLRGARRRQARLGAQLVGLRAQHVDAGDAADGFLRARRIEQLLLVGALAFGERDRFAVLHDGVPVARDVGGELLLGPLQRRRATTPPAASPTAR